MASKYIYGTRIDRTNEDSFDTLLLMAYFESIKQDSNHPNFSSLLSFYTLIEVLLLNDNARQNVNLNIREECGNRVPYFYIKINQINFPEKLFINKSLSEYQVFEIITKLRHKVRDFVKVRNKLDDLFLITTNTGIYMGNTEEAESSAF